MRAVTIESQWIRRLLPLLALYYVWTYLDPNLAFYMSTDGIFGHSWSNETGSVLSTSAATWLTVLFEPMYFYTMLAVGSTAAITLIFPQFKALFIGGVIVSLTIQSLFMLRNPTFYVIHRPYIGMLTMFLPYILWQSRRTLGLRPIDWLWSVTSFSYFVSAISKISNPHWLAGSALAEFRGFPIRSEFLQTLSPDSGLTSILTYAVMISELLHGLLGYFPQFRRGIWFAICLMHLGALPTLQIYVATVPMLLFHLFLFEPAWIQTPFFKGRWLKNPKFEIPMIYSFLWMTPIVILLSPAPKREVVALLLPLVILLSQGHKYAPHLLLILDKKTRDHVKLQRPRLKWELLGLIFVPTIIASITALLYEPDLTSKSFYLPVALLSSIYAAWTYFHFSQQNLGIMKLYRRLTNNTPDLNLNRIEFGIVTGVALVLTATICTFANERLGFYLFFFSPFEMPALTRIICSALCGVAGAILVLIYKRKGILNISTFLGIAHFVVLTLLLCIAPVYLALIAISVSHWTQAIYLTALQIEEARPPLVFKSRIYYVLVIGAIMAFSSIMYLAYDFLQIHLPSPSNFGQPDNFDRFSQPLLWLGLIYFGFNIGINYTHFFLERFIYRNNPRLKSDQSLNRGNQ